MSVNIIISGNLTGFSRFYTSPGSNEVFNEAKINFDYRNFVKFLSGSDQKVYTVSFSPKVVAVSLVTHILDSFSRPGIVVVTVFVPRNKIVSSLADLRDKAAIYKLLNEVNAAFYNNNVRNGYVNENPGIFSQDYYSDILSKYELVDDRLQKPVNAYIDNNTVNKRAGYIRASEYDMPKYLSSLMRKAYEGYHHVFFGENAPQNIDEPAEEIVTYRVKIENEQRLLLEEVRLSDRIYQLVPGLGYKDLDNKDYTYQEILNGKAGYDINGHIDERGIFVLKFNFPEDQKTIKFQFIDSKSGSTDPVPIEVLRPLLCLPGKSPIEVKTDEYTFVGREVTERFEIKFGNPDYYIDTDKSTSSLDLRDCDDGQSVIKSVLTGWVWNFNPVDNKTRKPRTIPPLKITLINLITGVERQYNNVTGAQTDVLPGNVYEWKMRIESDEFETIETAPNSENYEFRRKAKASEDGRVNGGYRDEAVRTRGNSAGGARSHPSQITAFEQSEIDAKNEKRRRNIKRVSMALAIILVLFVGSWLLIPRNDDKPDQEETDTEQPQGEESDDIRSKTVSFVLEDDSDEPTIDAENLDLLEIKVGSKEEQIEIKEQGEEYIISYLPENRHDSIYVKVLLSGERINEQPIFFASESYAISDLHDDQVIVKLSVRNSELTSYRELKDSVIPKDLNKQILRLSNVNPAYAKVLNDLNEEIGIDWSILDRDNVSLDDIKLIESTARIRGIDIPQKWKDRIYYLKVLIGTLRKGLRPTARVGQLSQSQVNKVKQIWRGKENEYTQFAPDLKEIKSLIEFEQIFKSLLDGNN